MALIDISAFAGMRPALAPHVLGQTEAQLVQGAEMASGELRPLNLPELESYALHPVHSMWLHEGSWRLYKDRRRFALGGVARSSRLYSSGEHGGLFMQEAGADSLEYKLGLTPPEKAPVRDGEPYRRSGTVQFVQNGFTMTGLLLQPDDKLKFEGDLPAGLNTNAVYLVLAQETAAVGESASLTDGDSSDTAAVGESSGGTDGDGGAGEVYRIAAESAPNVALEFSGGGIGTAIAQEAGDIQDRAYVFTVVNEFGDESAPGPASDMIRMDINLGIALTGLEYVPADGESPIVGKRIYRTATGTEGADWLFVDEIAAERTEYSDARTDAELAEVLPSLDWTPPPAALKHLTELPGGVLAAHDGGQVWLSKEFTPYAWPQANTYAVRGDIVSIAASQRTLFVLTKSVVHALTVEASDQAYTNTLDGITPCLSAGGVTSSIFGVLFPSNDGLYLVSQGSAAAKNLTEGLIDEAEWKKLNPASFAAAWFDTTYLAFYEDVDGKRGSLLLDFGENNEARMRLMDEWGTALQVIPDGRRIMMAKQSGGSGMWRVFRLFAGEGVQTMIWKSRKFILPYPVNPAALRVDGGFSYAGDKNREEKINFWGGCLAGQLCGEEVFGGEQSDRYPGGTTRQGGRIRIYGDDGLRADLPLLPGRLCPLPAGYSARVFEIEMTANVPVRRVSMATTTAEILQ